MASLTTSWWLRRFRLNARACPSMTTPTTQAYPAILAFEAGTNWGFEIAAIPPPVERFVRTRPGRSLDCASVGLGATAPAVSTTNRAHRLQDRGFRL